MIFQSLPDKPDVKRMIETGKLYSICTIFLLTVFIMALPGNVNAGQPEPITFIHHYSSPHGKHAIDKTVQTINTEHSLFRINAVSFEHEPFKAAIKAMLAGGNPPDIFLYWAGERVQSLVDAGHLAPIDDIWKQAKLNERFTPSTIQTCTYNGRKYVIPLTRYYVAFFYNKRIFDKHGISVPSTWPDFLEVCNKLISAGITPIALGSKAKWPAQFWFDYLLLRTAGPEYRHRLMSGNASYTDPEVTHVFDLWKEVVEQGYFNRNPNVYSFYETQKMLFHGQAAMTLTGSWIMGSLKKQGFRQEQDYNFFPFPTIDPDTPGVSLGPIDGVVLAKKEKVNVAKRALAYFADIAPQQIMCRLLGSLAPNQNVPSSVYTKLQQGMLNAIAKTPNWAFNYDLATPHPVAEAGLDSFVKFMDHPGSYLEILKRLDDRAKTHFRTR
ncbi:extracellular solute-binding protein [Desulfococcaceae bacterium HSG8]|nr:extracellular solute-binding protein [Desulfococcaceae bacterium HSG8]